MVNGNKSSQLGEQEILAKNVSLPVDWAWVHLGEIAHIVFGNSPPGTSYNRLGRGVPLINGPTEFGPGQLDSPRKIQYTDAPSRFCEIGDLLVCVRGSTTGRTNIASFQACIGRGVAAIRAGDCQPYVNHFVASSADLLRSIGTGSTFPNITREQLRSLAVPLPPLSEQRRLVEALEEVLADLDRGTAALHSALDDLARLRASVLQAAVSGNLTADHPARKNASETAGELLQRIDTERRRRAADGDRHLDDVQANLFPLPEDDDVLPKDHPTDYPQLPESWGLASFGQICETRLGRTRNPSNRAGRHSTPYLRAANITEDGLDLSDVLEMDFPPREKEQYRLQQNDLVVAEASGSLTQVGKSEIWNNELPVCCFQNTIIRLQPLLVLREYVLVLLQHCYFNGVFATVAAGVGINHLGLTRLSEIVVPIAPISEQAVLIEEVRQQLASVRASKSAIVGKLADARQLREAIFDKAFCGRLINPQQSQEPVQTLIERLKKQREEASVRLSPPAALKDNRHMTPTAKPRTVLDVLREHPEGLTPEALFTQLTTRQIRLTIFMLT